MDECESQTLLLATGTLSLTTLASTRSRQAMQKSRQFNRLKTSSYYRFAIHICWELTLIFLSTPLLSLGQRTAQASSGSASCSDWTPSLAMTTTPSLAGRGTDSLAFAFGLTELHLTFMRLVISLKHLYASCTPSRSTRTVLRITIFVNSRTFVSRLRVRISSETRFRSLGRRLSTVRLSKEHHGFHREVTKRSPTLPP